MRVSTLSRQPEQYRMFEEPMTMAASRNWCGDFYEEATARLLGGRRIRTDSQCDVCPDVVVEGTWDVGGGFNLGKSEDQYFEAKSLGTNGEALVYEARLKKDREFVDAGNDLTVAMWRHGLAVGIEGGMTKTDLRTALAAATRSLTLVPFDLYERIMLEQPIRQFSHRGPTKRGYGSYGYTEGRRVRLKRFWADELDDRIRRSTVHGLSVCGVGMPPFEIVSLTAFKVRYDEGGPRLVL